MAITGRAGDEAGAEGAGGAGPPEFELNGTFLGNYDARESSSRRANRAIPAADPGALALESLLDEGAALLPFHFLRTGDRLGRSVVKLLRGDGAAGTGFLVAPGILLTNNHVVPDAASASLAVAVANFEAGSPERPTSVSLDPEALFVTNAELDFTFCGVRGLDYLGAIALDRNSWNISPRDGVNIIQHPRGRPKEVALRDNRVLKADDVVIHYECSTEPGSSGSPVFNNRWEVVALHHASIRSEPKEASVVDDPLDDPASRYLNEGIRISAIALWLETDEANGPDLRDQVARLRGLFGGIDPKAGFFGALGRKALGRTAPEVVADRGEADDLDLAFWNIRGMEWGARERVVDVARVVADMGMDLWCLVHTDRDYVTTLIEHLGSYFGLDYECHHEPAGVHPALALLHRRGKALAVESGRWGVDLPEGVVLPPLITVRAATRRAGPVALRLVAVCRSGSPGGSAPSVEAVRSAIRHGHGEFDWLIVGEAPALLAPERLQVLADCGRGLIAAADERDGAIALLTGPRSRVSRVFVSPNLLPAFGLPEALTVARDRDLPPIFRALGGSQPIALRLALDGNSRQAAIAAAKAVPQSSEPASTAHDDDLEHRVRDMIAPVLARLLAEVRSKQG